MEKRLTNEEYEALADEYAKNPPELSGQPGFLTQLRQRALVNELLDQKYARIVNEKARVMSVSPSEVIASAIREKYADAV